jgi:quinone-modifying oxidoreductase subunit QmoC
MEKWKGWAKIQFESGLDPNFARQIASIPGGEKLYSCIQCGTCSGMCPLSPCMDYTPRQIIAMIRAGFREKVLSSSTTWLCSSCYACTVECPKEIKLTDIMYAAKRLAIREGVYPKKFPIPVLANEFFKAVEKYGRSTESWLTIRLYLKTNPFQLFKMAILGLRLFLHGRLSPKRESMENKSELRSILKVLEKEYMVKPKRQLGLPEKETS